jgi:hypothetical protein
MNPVGLTSVSKRHGGNSHDTLAGKAPTPDHARLSHTFSVNDQLIGRRKRGEY